MAHLRAGLIAGLAAATSVGGMIGYHFGSSLRLPEAPIDAKSYAPDLRDLRATLDTLTRSVSDLKSEIASAHVSWTEASRDLPTDRRLAQEEISTPAGVDTLVDRLTDLLQRFSVAGASASAESLRVARLQNPQPNLTAAQALLDKLERETKADRLTAKREWWLLGMDEVVRRLGTPSNIITRPEDARLQTWEYLLPTGDFVTLVFQNGLVVSID